VLLDHGANVNEREEDSSTPLDLATHNGHLETVTLLLERGVDVHVLNEMGETPYQVSLVYGYLDIANLIREHVARWARFEKVLFLRCDV
jgi:ankyrin repeat protein